MIGNRLPSRLNAYKLKLLYNCNIFTVQDLIDKTNEGKSRNLSKKQALQSIIRRHNEIPQANGYDVVLKFCIEVSDFLDDNYPAQLALARSRIVEKKTQLARLEAEEAELERNPKEGPSHAAWRHDLARARIHSRKKKEELGAAEARLAELQGTPKEGSSLAAWWHELTRARTHSMKKKEEFTAAKARLAELERNPKEGSSHAAWLHELERARIHSRKKKEEFTAAEARVAELQLNPIEQSSQTKGILENILEYLQLVFISKWNFYLDGLESYNMNYRDGKITQGMNHKKSILDIISKDPELLNVQIVKVGDFNKHVGDTEYIKDGKNTIFKFLIYFSILNIIYSNNENNPSMIFKKDEIYNNDNYGIIKFIQELLEYVPSEEIHSLITYSENAEKLLKHKKTIGMHMLTPDDVAKKLKFQEEITSILKKKISPSGGKSQPTSSSEGIHKSDTNPYISCKQVERDNKYGGRIYKNINVIVIDPYTQYVVNVKKIKKVFSKKDRLNHGTYAITSSNSPRKGEINVRIEDTEYMVPVSNIIITGVCVELKNRQETKREKIGIRVYENITGSTLNTNGKQTLSSGDVVKIIDIPSDEKERVKVQFFDEDLNTFIQKYISPIHIKKEVFLSEIKANLSVKKGRKQVKFNPGLSFSRTQGETMKGPSQVRTGGTARVKSIDDSDVLRSRGADVAAVEARPTGLRSSPRSPTPSADREHGLAPREAPGHRPTGLRSSPRSPTPSADREHGLAPREAPGRKSTIFYQDEYWTPNISVQNSGNGVNKCWLNAPLYVILQNRDIRNKIIELKQQLRESYDSEDIFINTLYDLIVKDEWGQETYQKVITEFEKMKEEQDKYISADDKAENSRLNLFSSLIGDIETQKANIYNYAYYDANETIRFLILAFRRIGIELTYGISQPGIRLNCNPSRSRDDPCHKDDGYKLLGLVQSWRVSQDRVQQSWRQREQGNAGHFIPYIPSKETNIDAESIIDRYDWMNFDALYDFSGRIEQPLSEDEAFSYFIWYKPTSPRSSTSPRSPTSSRSPTSPRSPSRSSESSRLFEPISKDSVFFPPGSMASSRRLYGGGKKKSIRKKKSLHKNKKTKAKKKSRRKYTMKK